jgi:hypothetical protein
MAETFTPAVCGGRPRRNLAVALFSLAAILTAAGLGAALGLVGGLLPGRAMLLLAVAVAVVAGLREAGVLRFAVPALRRQVPERWRRETPLAFWSSGYGALLGAGFGTFLPTATFWAACAGVLALGDVQTGAACLAAFGVGRGLMVIAAGHDPIRRLGRTHWLLRPVNAVALGLCAALLVPTAAFGIALPPPPPSGQSDPSVSNASIAYTDQANGATNVVVLEAKSAPVIVPASRTPSLDRDRLAYVDSQGIRIVNWRTGAEIFREFGLVDKPALSGNRLAFVRRVGARKRLLVRDLVTLRLRLITSVGPGTDLGRPSLLGTRLAWHEAAGDRNLILLNSLVTRKTQVIAGGRRSIANVNPVLTGRYIAWTQGIGEQATVLLRPLAARRPKLRVVTRIIGPKHLAGTMAITPGRLWVTRWAPATNQATILSYAWAE